MAHILDPHCSEQEDVDEKDVSFELTAKQEQLGVESEEVKGTKL